MGTSSGQISKRSTFWDIWIAPWWCGIISRMKSALMLLAAQAFSIWLNIVCVICWKAFWYKHISCCEFCTLLQHWSIFCIFPMLFVCSSMIFRAMSCNGTQVVYCSRLWHFNCCSVVRNHLNDEVMRKTVRKRCSCHILNHFLQYPVKAAEVWFCNITESLLILHNLFSSMMAWSRSLMLFYAEEHSLVTEAQHMIFYKNASRIPDTGMAGSRETFVTVHTFRACTVTTSPRMHHFPCVFLHFVLECSQYEVILWRFNS